MIAVTRPLVACLFMAVTLRAAGPTTAPAAGDDAQRQQWWTDLAGPDPAATRALLHFASDPAGTTAFFRTRLVPLKLTTDQLEPLLSDLASDDETVWKPAFEKLDYLDPRLAMNLVDLMKLVTEYPARGRLVDVVCNAPAGVYTDKDIRLEKTGDNDSYNFRGGNGSWWAEVRVDRINVMPWGMPKGSWTRAERAILLLHHFNTPEAKAIIADMATGHPEALPTKVAKDPEMNLVFPVPK